MQGRLSARWQGRAAGLLEKGQEAHRGEGRRARDREGDVVVEPGDEQGPAPDAEDRARRLGAVEQRLVLQEVVLAEVLEREVGEDRVEGSTGQAREDRAGGEAEVVAHVAGA